MDEKTCIPARPPVNPTLPTAPGLVARREFAYRRAGATCLFAALDVRTGHITHETKDRYRCEDFVEFLEHLDGVTAAELTLRIVAGNGPADIAKGAKRWLSHPAARSGSCCATRRRTRRG